MSVNFPEMPECMIREKIFENSGIQSTKRTRIKWPWRDRMIWNLRLKRLEARYFCLKFQYRAMKARYFFKSLSFKIQLRLLTLYCQFLYGEGFLTDFAIRDGIVELSHKINEFFNQAHMQSNRVNEKGSRIVDSKQISDDGAFTERHR